MRRYCFLNLTRYKTKAYY